MNISDDKLVFLKRNKEHDLTLESVLKRADEKNLRFNGEKCECDKPRPSEANGYWGDDNSGNLGGSGGMHPQIILKSRTPEIRFPASWEVIFYRKAHYKLEVW